MQGVTLEHIQIAQKMNRCRNAMKRLFLSDYEKKVATYTAIISGYGAKHNLDTLHSVIELGQEPVFRDSEYATIWLMAAAIEIIERDEKKE